MTQQCDVSLRFVIKPLCYKRVLLSLKNWARNEKSIFSVAISLYKIIIMVLLTIMSAQALSAGSTNHSGRWICQQQFPHPSYRHFHEIRFKRAS
jgi:hypothetical protein